MIEESIGYFRDAKELKAVQDFSNIPRSDVGSRYSEEEVGISAGKVPAVKHFQKNLVDCFASGTSEDFSDECQNFLQTQNPKRADALHSLNH
tara:strand:- start:85 stop:360 length:276 start_codon:yes stop_codon:yes gene_type:complete